MKKASNCFCRISRLNRFWYDSSCHSRAISIKGCCHIVPFGPGGGNDILIRLVAKYISPELNGQALWIEEQAGEPAARSAGRHLQKQGLMDTRSVLQAFPPMILVKSLRKNVPFEMDDFQYICNFQVDPIIWVVNKDSEMKTARDVMEFARKNPKTNLMWQETALRATFSFST